MKQERKSQLLIFRLNHGQFSLHDAPKSTGGYRASLAQNDNIILMQLARRTDTTSSRQSRYTDTSQYKRTEGATQ